MTTLLTPLPSLCFPQEVSDLSFRTDMPAATVEVELSLDGVDVLSTRLHSDASGLFSLEDLAELLMEQMPELREYTLCLRADGTQLAQTRLLPAAVSLGMPAESFLPRHFLTLQDGSKTVPADASERLAWYVDTDARTSTLTLEVTWWDEAALELLFTTTLLEVEAASRGCFSCTLRPATLTAPAEGLRLTGFVARCGLREQRYVVVPVSSRAVGFRNAFSTWDTFHFWGSSEREQKLERSEAFISGRLRTYRVEDASEEKLQSGHLPDAAIPLIEDLARSREVSLQPEGTPVVITQSELKTRSDGEAFNEGTITLRRSQRGVSVHLQSGLRTFDETFDESFG